jgi:ABC-type sugar transport system ATPase subunit
VQFLDLGPHRHAQLGVEVGQRLVEPKDEVDSRVGRAAAILGLEKLLDRYPRQLSGGQRWWCAGAGAVP